MASEEVLGTPAYIPWKTLTNTLDALAEHMPNRIDPSAFPGQSGTMKNQLLLTFRFFGFISEDGKPTPALLSVAVKDESGRKAGLRKLFEQKYAPLIALNLTKTTPAEFAEKMSSVYGVNGDTRLKATRFFLNAAEFLSIPVSPLLQRDKTKTIGAPTTTRKRRVPREKLIMTEADMEEGDQPEDVEFVVIRLQSGGTLKLSASTKFFDLERSDREFVFELLDKLKEYEKTQGRP